MNTSRPIEIEGKVYDKYSINFAVTGKYKSDKTPDANIALRLIPTRVVDGVVEQADDTHAKALLIGGIEQMDEAALQAFAAIQKALQTYITTKGI